jgi:formylglycine-generating enzyme required for sulfatase activity
MTAYAFGDSITPEQANFGEKEKGTTPVGKYPSNAWGLLDTHGNALEYCEDLWHPDYQAAPQDGSVWHGGDPSRSVVRGGSWSSGPRDLRSASRHIGPKVIPIGNLGFRVARTLTP